MNLIKIPFIIRCCYLREVLEASTVTLAPDRSWKAKLFPSLSSDFAENSAERDRKTKNYEMRQIGQAIVI